MAKKPEYNNESMTLLKGPDKVRKRPAVIFGSEKEIIELPVLIYGDTDDEQARRVFGILREIDEKGFSQAYVRCPSDKGVGLAVYNRLLRSAGFEVIRLEP